MMSFFIGSFLFILVFEMITYDSEWAKKAKLGPPGAKHQSYIDIAVKKHPSH